MRFTKESIPQIKQSIFSFLVNKQNMVMMFAGTDRSILPPLSEFEKKLLIKLDGKKTVEKITSELIQQGESTNTKSIIELLHKFDEKLLLEDNSTTDYSQLDSYDHDRYLRQILYFAGYKEDGMNWALEQQQKIKGTHIVLIGVGGFGCQILYQLMACGFGRITVVDFDDVDISNLNRQSMYGHDDINRPKLEVLKEQIKRQNPNIACNFINKKITSVDDCVEVIQGSDFVINASDTPRDKVFSWINEACHKVSVPVIFTLGALKNNIGVGPLVIPGQTVCYDCTMPPKSILSFDDELVEKINNQHLHGVIAPYIMIATGVMMLEVLKHLTGFAPCRLYNTRIFIDMFTYDKTEEVYSSRENCELCCLHGE